MRRAHLAIILTVALQPLQALAAVPSMASHPGSDEKSDNGQATTGAIQGQVTDSAGAAISGAKVSLAGPNYQSATQTDDTGTFKFFNIPFKEYKVRVESQGFLPAEQSIDIHTAVPVQLTFALKIAEISEQVNVT